MDSEGEAERQGGAEERNAIRQRRQEGEQTGSVQGTGRKRGWDKRQPQGILSEIHCRKVVPVLSKANLLRNNCLCFLKSGPGVCLVTAWAAGT